MKTEFTAMWFRRKVHLGIEVEWHDGLTVALYLLFGFVCLDIWREK